MPQGSLFDQYELNTVRIDLRMNRLIGATLVQLVAENRTYEVLASASLRLHTVQEAELLPAMLSMVGMGYLVGGARDAVTQPAAWLRRERLAFRQAR